MAHAFLSQDAAQLPLGGVLVSKSTFSSNSHALPVIFLNSACLTFLLFQFASLKALSHAEMLCLKCFFGLL